MYKVVEKFISINGEGQKMGELAIFIRFAGCNLDCAYCDTKWANEAAVDYEPMSKESIKQYIENEQVTNVTLTGGEPLLQEGMKELLTFLSKDEKIKIEIETNGSVDIKPFKELGLKNISFTVDYKLAESGMTDKMNPSNFKMVDEKDSVKFVISKEAELQLVKHVINQYKLDAKTKVFLSPVFGTMNIEEIVKFMKDNTMNQVKLQVQLHKIIWDAEKRGV